MKRVKRTERGWAGHFCLADRCLFRRNTLLECGKEKIVISTVGRMKEPSYVRNPTYEPQEIGRERYAETMAFWAYDNDGYLDANTREEVRFDAKWSISHPPHDWEMQEMHEAVVKEIKEKLQHEELHKEDVELAERKDTA